MDEKRNNRAVERKLSDCLRHDRARIQVGRISHFGLLEMSRQRIRASVLESSTEPCLHCGGTGHVRSVSSVALQLLRSVEETLMKGATHNLTVRTRTEVALYVLNHKRGHLRDLEDTFKVSIAVIADAAQQSFVIDHGEQVHTLEAAKALLATQAATAKQQTADAEDETEDFEDDVETVETAEAVEGDEAAEEPAFASPAGESSEVDSEGHRRNKRRRRRRGGRGGEPREQQPSDAALAPALVTDESEFEDGEAVREGEEAGEFEGKRAFEGERSDEDGARRRRRGRRGGRRRRGGPEQEEGSVAAIADDLSEMPESEAAGAVADLDQPTTHHVAISVPDEPQPELPQPAPPQPAPVASAAREADAAAEAAENKRRRSTVREKVSFGAPAVDTPAPAQTEPAPTPEASVQPEPAAEAEQPRRAGWWSRRFGGA
jgi:ribonuclease E